ncbi:hypothetical protein T484DRAFT_1885707 [Baffinella frigidus]|nr:hypothetical protein T484DRAFT_1885707 [Cryptophyta sp. CCMP2293]
MQKKVDILDKIEQLEVLTALSKSGILSKLERSRTLTKLENSGLLSTVEKLLPIVDEAGIISLTKTLVNTSPGILNAVWFGLILLPAAIVALVPDTNNGLVAVQVVSVPLCISLAAPLYFGAQVLKVIQGDEKVDLSGISKLLD